MEPKTSMNSVLKREGRTGSCGKAGPVPFGVTGLEIKDAVRGDGAIFPTSFFRNLIVLQVGSEIFALLPTAIHPSIHSFIHPSTHSPAHPSVHSSPFQPSTCRFIYPFIHMSFKYNADSNKNAYCYIICPDLEIAKRKPPCFFPLVHHIDFLNSFKYLDKCTSRI